MNTTTNDAGSVRVWHLLVVAMLAAGTYGGVQHFSGSDDPTPTATAVEAGSPTTLTAPDGAPAPVAAPSSSTTTATKASNPTRAAAPAVQPVVTSSVSSPTPTTAPPATTTTTTTTAVAASGPPYWCTVTLDRTSARVGETITGTVRTNSDRGRIMFQVWPNRYWFGNGTTFTQSFPVQDDDTGTVRVFINFSPGAPPDAECRSTYTVLR